MTYEEFEKRYEYDPQRDFLARGGFGAVYKAYDTVRKRYVAIKESDVDPSHKFSLLREVELSHEIDPHENVVRYINNYRFMLGRKSTDYAVMPYFEYGNLNQVLVCNPLTDSDKISIAKGLLQGVAHLHHQGVIHRDLKASNILMEQLEGHWIPKLTDFGISKLTDTNVSVSNTQIGLSIHYAAPEQLRNETILPNVDLWAVGVSLYKVVMGKLPFDPAPAISDAPTPNREFDTTAIAALINRGLTTEQSTQIPHPYRAVIEKCLIVDKHKRIKTAEELLELLTKPEIASSEIPVADISPIIPESKVLAIAHELLPTPQPDPIPEPPAEDLNQIRLALRRITANDTQIIATLNLAGATHFPLMLSGSLSTVEGQEVGQIGAKTVHQNGEIQVETSYPPNLLVGKVQIRLSLPIGNSNEIMLSIHTLVETDWYDWHRPQPSMQVPLLSSLKYEILKDNTGPTVKSINEHESLETTPPKTLLIVVATVLLIAVTTYFLADKLFSKPIEKQVPFTSSAGTEKSITTVIEAEGIYHNGIAPVTTSDGGKKYKNIQGHLFDQIRTAQCGRIPVRLGNLWGYLNLNGEIVINPHYDDAQSFDPNDCSALVTVDGKIYHIDKWGVAQH